MNVALVRAWGDVPGAGVIRSVPEDFQVTELAAFEPSGDGEHAFLSLEKRLLNTPDLVRRLAELAGVARADVGFSGMKDRNAVTRQWFSVRLAGKSEPDWSMLENGGNVSVLEVCRHRRKLKRGTHRGNRFRLRLRDLTGERAALQARLELLRERGAPNYFGEQRFGRDGATLQQAQRWVEQGGRMPPARRGLYLSALRSAIFNTLLASRISAGRWLEVVEGDTCMLAGSRSHFQCESPDATIRERLAGGDIHPGLPLWGIGDSRLSPPPGWEASCAFLQERRVDLAWRATRLLPDDFCWQFCDDDSLQLDFVLGAGNYATALLAEFVRYTDGSRGRGTGSEQG